jgi:hypothetical protein
VLGTMAFRGLVVILYRCLQFNEFVGVIGMTNTLSKPISRQFQVRPEEN